MAESQLLSVVRIWAAVAWADGVLAEPEAEGLRRLIRTADLTPDEREASARFLESQVELPETYLTTMSPEARKGVYRAACRMAVVDHSYSDTEKKLLTRLRDLLAIPQDVAHEIEADVPGMTAS
ncbi:MAG: TerB family tellurite resistance protein [Deltaproteobacteria bacterium]|nr:TerB family tellurite resistance protein [Deltaproteobacteria bacterium]